MLNGAEAEHYTRRTYHEAPELYVDCRLMSNFLYSSIVAISYWDVCKSTTLRGFSILLSRSWVEVDAFANLSFCDPCFRGTRSLLMLRHRLYEWDTVLVFSSPTGVFGLANLNNGAIVVSDCGMRGTTGIFVDASHPRNVLRVWFGHV